MIDLYNIPVYYIGFKENKDLEEEFKNIGFKNVNHFKAIDGRKYKPIDLLNQKIIDIRAYNDLVYGRHQHTGISSLGTIGCTLSHYELWKLCAEKYKYIIIAEDDVELNKLTQKDVKNIQESLNKPNGAFISTDINKGGETLIGLHLYFLTNGAAQVLSKKALPINLQTDSYVGHLSNIKNINLEGYLISRQKPHISSTASMCIKCILPKGLYFYVFLIILFIVIIVLVFLYYKKFKVTKTQLDSCRSSLRSISED
jgi:GR25 family glycosyltransferase involved in LPS biosynthesis